MIVNKMNDFRISGRSTLSEKGSHVMSPTLLSLSTMGNGNRSSDRMI
jgi:hypothetical protein